MKKILSKYLYATFLFYIAAEMPFMLPPPEPEDLLAFDKEETFTFPLIIT